MEICPQEDQGPCPQSGPTSPPSTHKHVRTRNSQQPWDGAVRSCGRGPFHWVYLAHCNYLLRQTAPASRTLFTCPHPALECPFFQPSPASQQMTDQENAVVQEAPLSPGSDWPGGLIARDDISHVEGHSKGSVCVLENVSVLVEPNCLHLHPDHIKHISNKVQAKPVVGCVYMCVCSVTSLCSPVDCSRPGTSVHGILHTGVLECLAISFPRGSSWPRNWTHVSCISCIGRRVLYHCTTWPVFLESPCASESPACLVFCSWKHSSHSMHFLWLAFQVFKEEVLNSTTDGRKWPKVTPVVSGGLGAQLLLGKPCVFIPTFSLSVL